MNLEQAITIKATQLARAIVVDAIDQELNGSLWEEFGDGDITRDDSDAITKAAEFVITAPTGQQVTAATKFLEVRAQALDAETAARQDREGRENRARTRVERRAREQWATE